MMSNIRNISISVILLLVGVSVLIAEENADSEYKFPIFTGDYFGQKPPGLIPEMFAPGIATTELHDDFIPVFSPKGDEVYLRFAGYPKAKIFYMKRVDDIWSEPILVPFMKRGAFGGFSADGSKLFFTGPSPFEGKPETKDRDIWWCQKSENGWTDPVNIGANVNTELREGFGSIGQDGTIYFAADYEEGYGKRDIYCSKLLDGIYQKSVNLGPEINDEKGVITPAISHDGSFLIFSVIGFIDAPGPMSLCVSFKNQNGVWGKPILIEEINSNSYEKFCGISPDGRYLFWVSNRETENSNPERLWNVEGVEMPTYDYPADIYWVDIKVIEKYRP
jgi:WD40-like Beta Propeller Repeat